MLLDIYLDFEIKVSFFCLCVSLQLNVKAQQKAVCPCCSFPGQCWRQKPDLLCVKTFTKTKQGLIAHKCAHIMFVCVWKFLILSSPKKGKQERWTKTKQVAVQKPSVGRLKLQAKQWACKAALLGWYLPQKQSHNNGGLFVTSMESWGNLRLVPFCLQIQIIKYSKWTVKVWATLNISWYLLPFCVEVTVY